MAFARGLEEMKDSILGKLSWAVRTMVRKDIVWA